MAAIERVAQVWVRIVNGCRRLGDFNERTIELVTLNAYDRGRVRSPTRRLECVLGNGKYLQSLLSTNEGMISIVSFFPSRPSFAFNFTLVLPVCSKIDCASIVSSYFSYFTMLKSYFLLSSILITSLLHYISNF